VVLATTNILVLERFHKIWLQNLECSLLHIAIWVGFEILRKMQFADNYKQLITLQVPKTLNMIATIY
jgi:hypothetical protein